MSLSRRVARNSTIYSGALILQKGIGFLLLPLYTRLLSPEDYGILALVLSVNSLLSLAFLLSLQGAAGRFYFEYRDQPGELRAFWGSILTFLLLLTLVVGSLLLWFGEPLLQPLLKDVDFFPYMVLGILTIALQPYFEVFLAILQATERPGRYGVLSVASFLIRTVLTLILVAGLSRGADGVLAANAANAAFFLVITVVGLRREVELGLRWDLLWRALRYSLPTIPHTVAGQIKIFGDRFFLTHLVSTSATGIYNIGFQLGYLVNLASISANRAFVPAFMGAMKSGDRARLHELRRIGLQLVFAYTFLAALLSLFSREIIVLFCGPEFQESWIVVPLLAFSFAANGIYLLYVNTLFFYPETVKWISVTSAVSMVLSLVLNSMLISWWGMWGAAASSLIVQIFSALLVAVVAHPHAKVEWSYRRSAVIYGVALTVAFFVNGFSTVSSWKLFMVKTAVAISLLIGLSFLAGGLPFFPAARGRRTLRTSSDLSAPPAASEEVCEGTSHPASPRDTRRMPESPTPASHPRK